MMVIVNKEKMMSDGLDVIIVDDDQSVCKVIASIIKKFYSWGNIVTFSDVDEAISYCLNREIGVAIFIVDCRNYMV